MARLGGARSHDEGEPRRGAAAIRVHAVFLGGVALCAVGFHFELGRALRGNALSWAYVIEWPAFALFGVVAWWHVLRGVDRQPAPRPPSVAPEHVAMLEAWRAHQRDLQASASERVSADDGPPSDAVTP